MSTKRNVSASPHIRSRVTTAVIMRDVCTALTPAALFGVYRFGLRALVILVLSMASCVISEYLYKRFMKKQSDGYECSALVTGLLLGMNLSVNVPYWVPVLGGVFAIIVVKQLFGGLGQNFMNPALAARCFLLISCAKPMASFGVEKASGVGLILSGTAGIDGVSTATPLAAIRAGGDVSLFDMFFGFTGGTIGETSAFLLLLGGIYMLARRVISIRIPAAYLLTFVLFMGLFGPQGFDLEYLAMQVCGGGLMIGAFFMATDYVTSPITPNGKIMFGIFLGILTGIFRIFGGSPEGVSYAIITGNILVPLIEKVTMPKSFGKGVKANG